MREYESDLSCQSCTLGLPNQRPVYIIHFRSQPAKSKTTRILTSDVSEIGTRFRHTLCAARVINRPPNGKSVMIARQIIYEGAKSITTALTPHNSLSPTVFVLLFGSRPICPNERSHRRTQRRLGICPAGKQCKANCPSP